MRIVNKILLIVLLTGIVLFTTNLVSYATFRPSTVTDAVTYDSSTTSDIVEMAGRIIGFMRNVSVVAAVIVISILGIKYMLGSVEEKAGYQKSFLPLIVGIVIVVSATTITSFIFDTLERSATTQSSHGGGGGGGGPGGTVIMIE